MGLLRSAGRKAGLLARVRHLAYTGAWKKCEPLWSLTIRAKRVRSFSPLLEMVLDGFGRRPARPLAREQAGPAVRGAAHAQA